MGNVDHQEYCSSCGEDTRWNNQADYEAFRASVDHFIRISLPVACSFILGGFGMIVLGFITVVAGIFAGLKLVLLIFVPMGVGINLIAQGLLRLRRAKKLKEFR
ncbi:MAG: hypothetical protein KDN19_09935 [Verrucomicrobiae bacterium]|nr:hypothetical protein [Verrucomicrobiae bacterium]